MSLSPRVSRVLLSTAYGVAIIAVANFAFGPRGFAAGCAIALLMFAWRHDNELGAFFPLAMLLVIMLAVIFAIFYLLIVIHPRM